MQVLRTPEEAFRGLFDFDFEPHYVSVPSGDGASLRIHYLDVGPPEGEVVLLMHGEPSWCYLYRHMIPVLAERGLRCVAPDLVGFGRSDKPAERSQYSYERHVAWMKAALFDELGLGGITLFGQDWGGLIGLRLLAEHEERFSRVVAANTGLPTGDQPMTEAFLNWQRFSQEVPVLPVGRILNGGCTSELSPEVLAAYEAPFPDESYKEGARQFPALVPTRPDDPAAQANRAAWEVLERLDKPFLCAFSDGDPITRGGERVFLDKVPGARSFEPVTIKGAGHFLQEDAGVLLANVVADFIAQSPV
jgi:haloalkane dehalogenase